MIRKVLIANRGEIAVRIIRTCRGMGIATVVVYSEPDRDSLAVAMADEAIALGGSTPSESYLVIEKVVHAALSVGADAVHPGFGFLAENAVFAAEVIAQGLTFIGPSPASIEAMGDKRYAKAHLKDVPFVPGYFGDDQGDDVLIAQAAAVGFPLMVKAAAGGGGKGMRLVQEANALPEAIASARREAQQAFGSDALMLERALYAPRHIEVQVFGDQHGSLIALGERECSIQRRHQKIVEEAPSSALTPDLRQRICDTALSIARQVGYYNAGTVEFLLDQDGQFYYMEMNTRLQVEHPVTEMIYGIDLVAWQIRAAEGERLADITGEHPLSPRGHAIEVRVYAEDPANGFLPVTGTLFRFEPAAEARTDSGVRFGDVISPYYDPMIAKVIAHGTTRADAIRRLHHALGRMVLLGMTTNVAYLRRVLLHPDHLHGKLSIRFVDDHPELLTQQETVPPAVVMAAAFSRGTLTPWRNFPGRPHVQHFRTGGHEFQISVRRQGQTYDVEVNGATHLVDIVAADEQRIVLVANNHRQTVTLAWVGEAVFAHAGGSTFQLEWINPLPAARPRREAAGSLRAPMPGKVVRVAVEPGSRVQAGDLLMILEAMKMEHRIEASHDGVVEAVRFQAGEVVSADDVLLSMVEVSPTERG